MQEDIFIELLIELSLLCINIKDINMCILEIVDNLKISH